MTHPFCARQLLQWASHGIEQNIEFRHKWIHLSQDKQRMWYTIHTKLSHVRVETKVLDMIFLRTFSPSALRQWCGDISVRVSLGFCGEAGGLCLWFRRLGGWSSGGSDWNGSKKAGWVRSKHGEMPWSEHTTKDHYLRLWMRSSWLVEADSTPVAACLAIVLIDCHIVLEELDPVKGLWS